MLHRNRFSWSSSVCFWIGSKLTGFPIILWIDSCGVAAEHFPSPLFCDQPKSLFLQVVLSAIEKLARITVASPESITTTDVPLVKPRFSAVSRQCWLQTRQFQLPFEIISRLMSFPVSHVASAIGFRVIQELQGFFRFTRRECSTHNSDAFAQCGKNSR